jgi:crotonobetainyl-CoA:carnitine CoA-transferase CaiB-like acyl-CoA transferase
MTTPHADARGIIGQCDDYRGIASPIRFSRTPGRMRRRPPRFAEHSTEILESHGYASNEIDALERDGIATVRRNRD